MKIAITNHTGGRNRGCEALARAMLLGFESRHAPLTASLHSHDPLYDQWRFGGSLTPVWAYPTMTPNHLRWPRANRLGYGMARLGERLVPSLRGVSARAQADLRQADAVVASGGDIFTSDYGNLRKHLAYPLMARGRPVYLCGHSIGPFTPADRDYFLRAAEAIALISVREENSLDYLRELDVQAPVELTADVAFTLPGLAATDCRDWLQRRYGVSGEASLVGLSVSQGIIKYSGLDAESYYAEFAALCDALLTEGHEVLLVPHVMESNPDNNDVIACDEVLRRVKAPGRVHVLSGEPGAVELKSAIGQCIALIGTRTHATIAAMSQGVPTVSIAYSRKAHGIMKDVYGETLGPRLTLAAKELSSVAMREALELALANPIDAERLRSVKARADKNFSLLERVL